jgi:2-polyprenyl-6-hydroxyphenyl methylase/3-demethylubiquinone-9 3-methyltransferase
MEGARTTVDPGEIEKFSKIADEWWNPHGKFRPLHKFNPARLAFIRDEACRRFGRNPQSEQPLSRLRLLDVGCGGGLVAEPMRRLGAEVVAIDASERNIKTAMVHAAELGLAIDYRTATVEDLVAAGEAPFDIVLNLEVVEHVADPTLFLSQSARLVQPGGMMMVATINRTLKAFALAKVGAEYILRWLPAGTHDPRKFLKPQEIANHLSAAGLVVAGCVGVAYNPLLDRWKVVENTDVNFMTTAFKD